jgi:hypothetical protein
MSMSDLFNPSFLLFFGFFLLVIAILVVYFESKSRVQNHKIASMFSIISTLAEDLNYIKLTINQVPMDGGSPALAKNNSLFNNQEQSKLIEVSDEEESDEEDDDVEEESDEEDEYDEESESENMDDALDEYESELDEESEIDSESDSEVNNIKVLNITNLDPLLEKNFASEINEEYDQDHFEEEQIESLELEQMEPLEIMEDIIDEKKKNEKSIKIDLGETTINDQVDYKKFTLQKLKTIVTEKGLATDTSKLKKPELLKLLGIE